MAVSLRSLTLVVTLGAVLVLPGAASADIARHCTGYMGARLLSGVDKNGKTWFQQSYKALAGVVFKGKGVCKNRLKANDCRRQARDLIVRCGRDLWAQRWSRKVPSTCIILSGSSRPYGGIQSWGSSGISPSIRSQITGDVKRAVEHSACCVLRPTDRRVNFAVYLAVHGDTGCKHNSTVENLYKADCKTLRARGLCGGPRRSR